MPNNHERMYLLPVPVLCSGTCGSKHHKNLVSLKFILWDKRAKISIFLFASFGLFHYCDLRLRRNHWFYLSEISGSFSRTKFYIAIGCHQWRAAPAFPSSTWRVLSTCTYLQSLHPDIVWSLRWTVSCQLRSKYSPDSVPTPSGAANMSWRGLKPPEKATGRLPADGFLEITHVIQMSPQI